MSYLKSHWQLIALTGVIFALWSTPVVVPLRIFVVFLHEFSHALAAWLTGGSVVEMSISAREGGFAITRGGSRFAILSAGYLGSLLLGLFLLLAALRTDLDRALMGICGAVMLLVAALYVREAFALLFCVGTGAVMVLIARVLPRDLNDFALRILGLTSLIYVPYDIFDDTIRRAGLRSDAFMLAEEFIGTTMMWGGLWLGLSLAAIFVGLRYGLGRTSNIDWSGVRGR